MTHSSWIGLRVFYHDDNKDSLLLDGIWPHVEALKASGKVRRAYFDRGWLGGPHIQVCLDVARQDLRSSVVDTATSDIRHFLETSPSTAEISGEEYQQTQAALAWWEVHSKETPPLEPNNTVREEPLQFRTEFWGGDQALELAQDFFSSSAGLILAWIDETRAQPQKRLQRALQLMIGIAWLADPQLRSSHMSFRSHAEAIFAGTDEGSRLRNEFELRYQKQKEILTRAVRLTLEQLDQRTEGFPGFNEYLDLARRTWDLTLEEVKAGRVQLPSAAQTRETFVKLRREDAPDWNQIAGRSDFHTQLLGSGWQRFMNEDPRFLTLRVLLNLLYTNLQQLGIRALERYQLCWFIARATEDALGIDTISLAKEAEERLQALYGTSAE